MNVPIKIFYHVFATLDWLNIVKEQMKCLIDSGLYDECEAVNVSIVGGEGDSLFKAITFFDQYKKAYIVSTGKPEEHEFVTLRAIKANCDIDKEKHYVLYMHTKSVSRSGPDDPLRIPGKAWRRYMMKYLVDDWRKCYQALDMKYRGYDIVGVKIVPARESPSGRTHASGSMVWVNSEYVKSLKPIDSVDVTQRHEAEMYLFSGQPIIYMPCNLFIDYMSNIDFDTFIENYKELPDFLSP